MTSPILRLFRQLFQLFRVSVYDVKCRLCEGDLIHPNERIVCIDCIKRIERHPLPLCSRCGKRVSGDDSCCGECLVNPPDYIRHQSFGIYESELRELIVLFKYTESMPLKDLFADFILTMIDEQRKQGAGEYDFVMSVPRDRGRRREYDRMGETVKLLSKRGGIAVIKPLVKIKKTPPQTGLSMAARKRNLIGAFKVKRGTVLSGKSVLLVDDVYTTGSTIGVCTKLLKKAGADVYVLTLARSI